MIGSWEVTTVRKSRRDLVWGGLLLLAGVLVDVPFFPYGLDALFRPGGALWILPLMILSPLALIGGGLYLLLRP